MFSLSTIKSNLKIVRPNLLFVEISLPTTLSVSGGTSTSASGGTSTSASGGASAGVTTSTLKYRCESTELPGRTLATSDEQSFGSSVKHAYEVTYNDLTVSIIASEDMNERRLIETWMDNTVRRPNATNNTGGLIKYYNDYASGTVNIYQLNDQKKQLVKCTLNRVYPIALGPLNLTWEENDTYQRFAVTFAYRWHTTDFTQDDLSKYFS